MTQDKNEESPDWAGRIFYYFYWYATPVIMVYVSRNYKKEIDYLLEFRIGSLPVWSIIPITLSIIYAASFISHYRDVRRSGGIVYLQIIIGIVASIGGLTADIGIMPRIISFLAGAFSIADGISKLREIEHLRRPGQ
ncbi:hypothetical protein QH494_04690 [Sphingomonas sp. AR_OL41]|uniref:hypothetical protein n=1 Tax=Sphingomonas sp. AR_OL41 TaxID=3042729 RepID=UPI0024803690|nr:hypothetical protein [Sphingomonas sp. AR_OL41]MDH7971470.1 hypothetical protein [Sphingomonas sp. AR_OL41]